MKVAFVAPRWSPTVRGGAETAARELAERLVADLDWEVEAFTSRALDHFTWANDLPEGTEDLAGVRVHRFTCTGVRFDDDPDFAARVIHYPRSASEPEARRWVEMQGPMSTELLDAVERSDADLVVFTPYLFAPTVFGVPRAPGRAVMAAAAHDEPLIRLPVYREAFRAAAGFVYYTPEERDLVERMFSVGHVPHAVPGIGIDTDPPAARAAAADLPGGVGDAPFVVVLGRVEEGKGCAMLARYFAVYKERRPGPLRLVFAGPVTQPERYEHPDIVLAGPVDEATKWALLRRASAFVSPSPYESFSIVLMEAWTTGQAALVNGRCAVTRGHAARSGGGLWFDDYPMFEAALDRLLADPPLRSHLGRAGRTYVEHEYAWPVVLDRYRRFFEALAQRRAA